MAYFPTKLPDAEPIEARTFTPDLDGLIAWLSTQDPATEYHVWTPARCAFGLFHAALGIPVSVHFMPMFGEPGLNSLYPAADFIAWTHPLTFGAALSRARAARARNGRV